MKILPDIHFFSPSATWTTVISIRQYYYQQTFNKSEHTSEREKQNQLFPRLTSRTPARPAAVVTINQTGLALRYDITALGSVACRTHSRTVAVGDIRGRGLTALDRNETEGLHRRGGIICDSGRIGCGH